MRKVLNLLQIEYYFFIIRVNKETINKMMINIRNEISKSFFFIIIKPPFVIVIRKSASTQQLVFPVFNISIKLCPLQQILAKLYKLFSEELPLLILLNSNNYYY